MESNAQSDKLGQRICVSNHFGTIRYHGPVPLGSNTHWYGIEWDDASRGKHSGNHEGTQYFQTRVPNSGSFLRVSKVPPDAFARSFLEAFQEKYLSIQPQDGIVRFGGNGVDVETVGWDKISRKLAQAGNIREVGLAGMRVGFRGGKDGQVRELCPAIVDLDLSRSLFQTWNEVADICRELAELQSLRLAFNRIQPLEETTHKELKDAFSSLRALTLIGTLLTWEELQKLETYLPQLKELHLGFNHLESFSHINGFQSIQFLNIEHNDFTSWAEIRKLARLPSLRTLMINNNYLASIEAPAAGEFAELTTLNISNNQITSWTSIHALNSFPALVELRLRRNPVLDDVPSNDLHPLLIARLAKLTILNGSTLTPRERSDAELYYLGRCAKELSASPDPGSFHFLHPRYEELARIHGAPTPVPVTATSSILKDRLSTITFCYGSKKIKKKIPNTMNIRALKVLASRILGVKGFVHLRKLGKLGAPDIEMEDDLRDVYFYDVENDDEIVVYVD
ncbi:hypothetical protein SpCBS45565_g03407 [Spizellomyces sp. 'palustris']|nr:hypothetical protein SpCBS45565_g03407 [Spizellomyces sp. 'palustris']